MNRIDTKNTAESVLRELPSVLGASVSQDVEGQLREIHVLVRHGPDPAELARDIRSLLEERLGIPIDQRVVSIAQLAETRDGPAAGERQWGRKHGADPDRESQPEIRPVFVGLESRTTSGQITVRVRLEWRDQTSDGTGEALDTKPGRARAAAVATLRSATGVRWNDELDLELEFASILEVLDRDYVLVSVLGMARRLGRRPLGLVGAHPVEGDVESAAALATLKAINRLLSRYSSSNSDRSAK